MNTPFASAASFSVSRIDALLEKLTAQGGKEAELTKKARLRESPTQKLDLTDNFSVAHHLGGTSD